MGGSRLISVFQQTCAPQDGQEILFHSGQTFSGNRVARHEDEFNRFGQFMLVQPETFAQQAAGTTAFHRPADFFAGHHAKFGRHAFGQTVPIGNEAAENKALAGLTDPREIAILRQARQAAEAQAFRRFSVHDARAENGLYGRQAFAAYATAIGQRGLAALGGITVQKPVLAFATNFRRLILAFHKFKLKSKSGQSGKKPESERISTQHRVSRRGNGWSCLNLISDTNFDRALGRIHRWQFQNGDDLFRIAI